jgi:hypothetical protein
LPELVLEIVQDADGGYCAACLTDVIEATSAFFFGRECPARTRLHLIRDEILSVA